jgi:hypothetical protein
MHVLHERPLDVSQPYDGELVDCDSCVCGCDITDTYADLLLLFDTQQIVAALGEVPDRECLVVNLEGNLLEEYGGTPIYGDDILKILNKVKVK